MKRFFQFFIALAAVLWAGMGMASQTRVVINLSEQKAANCSLRAGIEFFPARRLVSLFPVVRPKEEAIWPESAERALLSWLKVPDE